MMEFMGYEVYGISDIILGIIAMAATIALFLCQIPTFWRILRQKSTAGWQPFPHMAIEMASIVWMGYAAPIRGSSFGFHNNCLLFVSQIGFTFQKVYIYSVYYFTTADKQIIIMDITGFGELLFFVVIPYSMGFRSDFIFTPEKTKVLGPMSVLFGLVMYASPLPLIINAYRTRRIDTLPFGFCIFFCLNAIAWFSYAFLYPPTFDSYVAIANGGGIILTVVQLILCFIFRVKLQDSASGAAEGSTPLLHESP